jgi:site-specific DNA-methyltransferase (adenine-specific)
LTIRAPIAATFGWHVRDDLEERIIAKKKIRGQTYFKVISVKTELIHGDCLEVLKTFPDNSFDLIVTSPPYADQRNKTYGGIKPDRYVAWFVSRSAEFLRVLKPTGSFVLNIKEKAENGERHVYVLELILALRQQGWLWTEEYIWHKKNCHPGKWPNRFRDAWERCLQFNKSRHFKMFQDAVMVPMGDWRHARLRNLSETDKRRDDSKVQSGFGKRISNWIGREMAYPSNVLHFATECGNKKHSATFPKTLPEWFIKLYTEPGDWVLDPFMGSGTTNIVAEKLARNSVGIDALEEYIALAQRYLAEEKIHGSSTRNGHSKGRKKEPNEQLSLGKFD